MHFRTRCTNGATWFPRWWPADGAPVHFLNRGPTFDVREWNGWTTPSGADARMHAWMTGHTSADHRSISGSTRFVARFKGGDYSKPVLCDSGPVTYTVSRTS